MRCSGQKLCLTATDNIQTQALAKQIIVHGDFVEGYLVWLFSQHKGYSLNLKNSSLKLEADSDKQFRADLSKRLGTAASDDPLTLLTLAELHICVLTSIIELIKLLQNLMKLSPNHIMF